LPLAVGFGITTPAQARATAQLADGVVVGSALVDALGSGGLPAAERLIRELAAAVRGTDVTANRLVTLYSAAWRSAGRSRCSRCSSPIPAGRTSCSRSRSWSPRDRVARPADPVEQVLLPHPDGARRAHRQPARRRARHSAGDRRERATADWLWHKKISPPPWSIWDGKCWPWSAPTACMRSSCARLGRAGLHWTCSYRWAVRPRVFRFSALFYFALTIRASSSATTDAHLPLRVHQLRGHDHGRRDARGHGGVLASRGVADRRGAAHVPRPVVRPCSRRRSRRRS